MFVVTALNEVVSFLGRNRDNCQRCPRANVSSKLITEMGNENVLDLEETRLYMHYTGSTSFPIHKAIKIVQLANIPREAACYKDNQVSILYTEAAG
jgi:hypothetical protein